MTTIGNVKVKDAVIDWHVNKSNWPTLVVITEEDVPVSFLLLRARGLSVISASDLLGSNKT